MSEARPKLTAEQQLWNLASALECYAAFSPYYPEMLDFDLKENLDAEQTEITEYLASFKRPEDR